MATRRIVFTFILMYDIHNGASIFAAESQYFINDFCAFFHVIEVITQISYSIN